MKKIYSIEVDDIELEYLKWAVDFTIGYVSEDNKDFVELKNLQELLKDSFVIDEIKEVDHE